MKKYARCQYITKLVRYVKKKITPGKLGCFFRCALVGTRATARFGPVPGSGRPSRFSTLRWCAPGHGRSLRRSLSVVQNRMFSLFQLPGNLGDVAALKPGYGKFVLTRQAAAVRPGQG